MKDIRGIRGKYYIARLIEEGEHETQDFKYAITDARKIARSLSAFANHSGGRLLIGVKDNGVVAGVRNEEDIYLVEQAAERYCIPAQPIRVDAFIAEGGARVMRVEIDPAPERPVMVDEGGGTMKAYYRVADENIAAHPLMVRAWRERALSSGMLIRPDGTERLLLDMLAVSTVTVDDFMLRAHISREKAEDVVVKMHCASLVDFCFDGDRFVLTLSK
ncbi:MAG: ATP-binding protein [Duncaniella sp.]|nr:ATP-binding protein [Duncaniella sp.]